MSLTAPQHLTPETEQLEHDIEAMFQGDQTGVGASTMLADQAQHMILQHISR